MSYKNLFDSNVDCSSSAIYLDNAATTPAFSEAISAVQEALKHYGSISRGTGIDSDWATFAYAKSKLAILNFLGVEQSSEYNVVYTKNATEGFNLLAQTLIEPSPSPQVIISRMEHHSNDLPWRLVTNPLYFETESDGRLNLNDLNDKLTQSNGSIQYVCVTAASNISGYRPDIHHIARIAHRHGAKIIVDGAQLIAHEAISLKGYIPDADIDFFVFSGHKMYAPFGCGVIVGKFSDDYIKKPFMLGGGTVTSVTDADFTLSPLPQYLEAGTQNIAGAVAIDAAIQVLSQIGFRDIKQHERTLRNHLMRELTFMPHVILYGDITHIQDRIGIIPFNIKDRNYMDVSMTLAEKYHIATRCGKCCAEPYVERLFNSVPKEFNTTSLYYGEKGFVRLSLGLCNTHEELDRFLEVINTFK